LLDEGPPHYQAAVLQIIYQMLVVMIDVCLEQQSFKNKIPEWFGLVAKFLNGPLLNEAMQVLSVSTKQPENGAIEFETPTHVGLQQHFRFTNQAFPNKHRLGTTVAAKCLGKVLETVKFSEKSKSIKSGISPAFWNKFFSSGDVHNIESQTTSTADQEEESEIDEQETMGSNRYIMDEPFINSDSSGEEESDAGPKPKDGESPAHKFKFQQPMAFARFPSFHGFEELLDFGDLEKELPADEISNISAETAEDAQEEEETEG